MIRTQHASHKTRFSDSSFYDEKCVYCGGTDGSGDDSLYRPCPNAPKDVQVEPKEPGHMWSTWRDKKGVEEALTGYFPETLAASPELQLALAQYRNAQTVMDAFFAKKAEAEQPND